MKIVFKGAISNKDKRIINETLDHLCKKLSPVFNSVTLSHVTVEIKRKLDSRGQLNCGEEHYDEQSGIYYWQPTIALRKDGLKDTNILKAVVCHEFMHFIDYVKNPFVKIFYRLELWKLMDMKGFEELKIEHQLGWDNWIDERLAKMEIENPQKPIIKYNYELIEWHTPIQ